MKERFPIRITTLVDIFLIGVFVVLLVVFADNLTAMVLLSGFIGLVAIELLVYLIKKISRKYQWRNWARDLCACMISLLVIFLTSCGVIYSAQNRLLFYNVDDPESRLYLTGKSEYQEVVFTAANKKTYHGMMYQPGKESAPLIIYFGGNGECSYRSFKNMEKSGAWQYLAGYNFLYVDYEGYGLNSGNPNYQNMYEEALAIYDYALTLTTVSKDNIVVMGFSIGTGSAVYLAANRPVNGLILLAPYASGLDLYNNALPIFYGPMQLLVRQKLPSEQYAGSVSCPILVVASLGDEVVPFSSTDKLIKAFSGTVDLLLLDEEGHNGLLKGQGVYTRIKKFLQLVEN